jgi:hypothetical protein
MVNRKKKAVAKEVVTEEQKACCQECLQAKMDCDAASKCLEKCIDKPKKPATKKKTAKKPSTKKKTVKKASAKKASAKKASAKKVSVPKKKGRGRPKGSKNATK